MIKRMLSLTAIVSVALLAGPVPAQQNGGNEIKPVEIELADEPAVVIGGVEFTVGDAIRYAIEKNHTIISGAYDVAMADTDAQSLRSKYSPVIIGEAGGKNQKNTEGAQFLYGIESSSADASVTVAKKFETGTSISTGLKYNYTDSDLAMKSFSIPGIASVEFLEKYHMPIYFVQVEQELLKNVVGYADRRTEKKAKLGADIQKDYILFALSQVVVGVIADYWDVVSKKTVLANADLQVQETRKVRDIIARNVRLGLSDDFSLNFYNARLSGAEAQRIEAQRAYRDSLRKFLTTINFDSEGDLTGTAIMTENLPALNVEEALKAAYQKRADYINAQRQLEISRLELQIQKNDALPSLTAEFNASTMGQQKDAADAFEDMGKFKYTNIEGKVKVTYLFDNRAQTVAERNARFRLKQAEIGLDKTRREVKDDVISKIEQINATHGMYIKMKDARREAEVSYRRMVEDLRRGRLMATIVKDGLDGLIEFRQRELDALVYYNISLLLFEVSKNELYEKYNIDVNKYIPKDKK
ncbi:MAG TPA: TolC family protein [Spirochaetota bacterium]|nr:TolC family protein [Spirochaetota bacterium]HSA14006.1 TolC family protein [Spirochaetota bacterium]